jgi:hypothetical protein
VISRNGEAGFSKGAQGRLFYCLLHRYFPWGNNRRLLAYQVCSAKKVEPIKKACNAGFF